MTEREKTEGGSLQDESRRAFFARGTAMGAAYSILAGCTTRESGQMSRNERKMLGRCGYRCDLCAARSDDAALRQKMVEGWRKYWGHERYTAENVRCDGCLAEGRLADKNCGVRPCAIEKGVANCAYCDEFPCERLKKLMSSPHLNLVRFGEVPEEDYDLCMRQFDNIPELLAIRRELKQKKADG